MTMIFSAQINADQGSGTQPVPIADIAGWTVHKEDQLEIYRIRHNLGLTDPERQLHIVATPMDEDIIIQISGLNSNDFTLSTWGPGVVPKESAFMFIAVQREINGK